VFYGSANLHSAGQGQMLSNVITVRVSHSTLSIKLR